jgi:hypothetical protein
MVETLEGMEEVGIGNALWKDIPSLSSLSLFLSLSAIWPP